MKKFLFIMALCMCCIFVNAQADQGKNPDNYQLVEKPFFTDQEALEYYNQRLKVNSKDGEAHAWIARICLEHGDYDKALTAANAAIKYLPKEDTESLDFVYNTRALVYFYLDKENLAEIDSKKLLTSSNSQYVQQGYLNIGIIQYNREQFDDAIVTYTKVINLYPDYAQAYEYRASTFFTLYKYEEMAADLIKALEVDYDNAFYMLATLDDEKAIQLMVTKLHEQTLQFPDNAKWWLCYGVALELDKQYAKAIEMYEKCNQFKRTKYVDKRIENCQKKLTDSLGSSY
jgi:tetratricopeptide (TPR) repeat protein